MSLLGKLVISLVVAAVASTVTGLIQGESLIDITRFIIILVATITTAVLVTLPAPALAASAATGSAPASASTAASNGGNRENGTVKWFNVTKGFGFITRENGEEIFVHFRSIRGEGRRSLRDDQAVSFVVTDSDKGPQAEDVEAID